MKVDVIFVTCNHENMIKDCYDKVKKDLKDIKHTIIFVDNCSNEDTSEILTDIYNKDEDHTRIVKLSKHTNFNSCVIAGLNYSKGKYAIIYDMDLDCNVNIKKMIKFLEENKSYDSICLCRNIKEDSFFKKQYKKLVNDINFYKNIDGLSNFRVLNRKMIDAVVTHSIDNEITGYTFDNIGFNIYYDYIKTETECEEHVYVSTYLKPVVLSMILGSVCMFIAILFLIISLILNKTGLAIITFALLFFIAGGLLILLGVVGRNMLKHIYKKEPNFIIKERIGFDENVL